MQEKKLAAIGLSQKREEVTGLLSECFTRDLLGMDDYEKRIELVHQAATIEQLETLVADVPENIMNLPANRQSAAPAKCITVKGGIERISGRRLSAASQEIVAKGSMLRIDFRRTEYLPGDIDIKLQAKGSQIKIIVPPDVQVENLIENDSSIVRYKRSRKYDAFPVNTRIHISGTADGSMIRIVTRKAKRRRSRYVS